MNRGSAREFRGDLLKHGRLGLKIKWASWPHTPKPMFEKTIQERARAAEIILPIRIIKNEQPTHLHFGKTMLEARWPRAAINNNHIEGLIGEFVNLRDIAPKILR